MFRVTPVSLCTVILYAAIDVSKAAANCGGCLEPWYEASAGVCD